MRFFTLLAVFIIFIQLNACYETENLNVPVKETPDILKNDLDRYIDEEFTINYTTTDGADEENITARFY